MCICDADAHIRSLCKREKDTQEANLKRNLDPNWRNKLFQF